MQLNESMKIAIEHDVDDLPLWHDKEAHAIMTKNLVAHGIKEEQFIKLIAAYRELAHKQRTRGLFDDFDDIFMIEEV